jgi:hypothetical protein
LVSAPAGFGKTTLVTEWLAEAGPAAVAWVSLDERDNEPATFWTRKRCGEPSSPHVVIPGGHSPGMRW